MRIEAREYLVPDWPAPRAVRAVSTTRSGGVSNGAYRSFNLGAHCGDRDGAVEENRILLRTDLRLPAEPTWLRQVHGARVIDADSERFSEEADAAVASRAGTVCAIMTADCVPVLLCNRHGTRVGAAHAGWRGLAAGVLESVVSAMDGPDSQLFAWIGPAIGQDRYEVGEEVRQAFLEQDDQCRDAFRPSPGGRWLADLAGLARRRLTRAGVRFIYAAGACTYDNPQQFFSHRRDRDTGRMASLIWLHDKS